MSTAGNSHKQQQDAENTARFGTPGDLKQLQDEENHARFGIPAKLQRYEQIIDAFSAMTAEERADLAAWEAANLKGDGTKGTSDWPLWDEIIGRTAN